jgi:outer membrane biosynthesis protein TonB
MVFTEEATPARRSEPSANAATATPGPVDRRALGQAVARAAGAASSCAQGPEKGRVALTFSPSGSVQSAQLEQSFGEPGINSCVLRAMGRARVRPFVGEAVTVHKTLRW